MEHGRRIAEVINEWTLKKYVHGGLTSLARQLIAESLCSMNRSTLWRAFATMALAPVLTGCAGDAAVKKSADKAGALMPPVEFANLPDAEPIAKATKRKRIVDNSIQQASATEPVLKKKSFDAQLSMARLTERSGQPDQARAMYESLTRREPKHPVPHHRLGVIAAGQKKWAAAEHHFRKAYTLAAPSSELLSDMSYYYYLRQRLDEAEQLSRRALQIDPENTTAHNNLGLILGEKGDFAASLASFRRAVPVAEAHANLGYVLAQSGRSQEALAHYSTALSHDSSLVSAAKAMLQVAERSGHGGQNRRQARA